MRHRRITAAAAALFIIGSTVFAAGPASAADFDPALGGSSSAARQWKINVLGKLLGKAAPTAWQREQLANSNKYNQAWETLEAMYGTSANGPYTGPPDSYQDYVIRQKEIETTGKLTVTGPGGTTTTKGSGKTFTAPASKASKLVKGVAGGTTAVTGVALGLQLGNAGADLGLSFFGQTKEGLICSEDVSDGVKTWASLVNGVDCQALAVPSEFIPNTDAETGTTTKLDICDPQGYCWSYVGLASGRAYYNSSVVERGYCFSGNGAGAVNQMSILFMGTTQNGSRVLQAANIVTTGGGQYTVCPAGGGQALTMYNDEYEQIQPEILCAIQSSGRNCDSPGSVKPEVVEGTGNPERTIVCTIVGTDGKTYSAESAAYTEEDGTIAAPECPTLPEGVAPASGSLDQKNQESGKTTPLAPIDVNQEFLDWWTNNPECRTGACSQELFKRGTDGQLLDCFESDTLCRDWFTDPNKAQNYQCRYNDKDVDLENCYVYSGIWQPGRLASGSPYSDPLTGSWSKGQNAPGLGESAMGTPVQNPDTFRTCATEVGSLNPVEWVTLPVKCALEWAFVPRSAVVNTSFGASNEAWKDTPPAKMAGLVGGLGVDLSVSGCSGIPIVDPITGTSATVGNSCSGIQKTMASTSYTITTVLACIGGVWAIVAIYSSVIGYRGLTVAGGNH